MAEHGQVRGYLYNQPHRSEPDTRATCSIQPPALYIALKLRAIECIFWTIYRRKTRASEWGLVGRILYRRSVASVACRVARLAAVSHAESTESGYRLSVCGLRWIARYACAARRVFC